MTTTNALGEVNACDTGADGLSAPSLSLENLEQSQTSDFCVLRVASQSQSNGPKGVASALAHLIQSRPRARRNSDLSFATTDTPISFRRHAFDQFELALTHRHGIRTISARVQRLRTQSCAHCLSEVKNMANANAIQGSC